MTKMTITKKNLKLLQNSSEEFDIFAETFKHLVDEDVLKDITTIQKTLKLSFDPPLTSESLNQIDDLSPVVSSLSQSIKGLHPKFLTQINALQKNIHTVFLKSRNKEDDDWDKKYKGFNKIGDKNQLSTVWSLHEINPSDMKKPFSDKPVKSLIYESWGPAQNIKIGKIATWLDMWKFAEQAIKLSGDEHHIFIEAFVEDKNKPGQFKLVTGS